jgi:hypothetical protein
VPARPRAACPHPGCPRAAHPHTLDHTMDIGGRGWRRRRLLSGVASEACSGRGCLMPVAWRLAGSLSLCAPCVPRRPGRGCDVTRDNTFSHSPLVHELAVRPVIVGQLALPVHPPEGDQ